MSAMADPAALRNRSIPIEIRGRMAYSAGAEEDAAQTLGRGLTLEELRATVARYPGDPDEVAERCEREGRGDPPR
jgi:hypothetical protein